MTTKKQPGLILVNLGSPDSPSVSDVRRYLGEFLMDERVIDSHVLIRNLVVRGIILTERAQIVGLDGCLERGCDPSSVSVPESRTPVDK